MEKSTLRLTLLSFVLYSRKHHLFSKIFVRFYTIIKLKISISPPNNKVALQDGFPASSFSEITKA